VEQAVQVAQAGCAMATEDLAARSPQRPPDEGHGVGWGRGQRSGIQIRWTPTVGPGDRRVQRLSEVVQLGHDLLALLAEGEQLRIDAGEVVHQVVSPGLE